jgi:hypothetical protein
MSVGAGVVQWVKLTLMNLGVTSIRPGLSPRFPDTDTSMMRSTLRLIDDADD